MAKHGMTTQQDLFEVMPPVTRLEAAERAKVLEQLRALLIEAITTATDPRETGDDQDHA